MLKFICIRLLQAIPVLLIIATLTFFMVRLAPGDPISNDKAVPPEIRANLEAFYGFDDSLWVQYLRYMGNLLRGDLGPSYKYVGWSVNELIAQSFPVSLELGVYAFIIALLLGTAAGVVAALKKNSLADYVPMSFAMTGICLPTFVMGPMLVLVFAMWLGWFNPLGWDYWYDRILPAFTLGLYYSAYIARLSRGGMLDVLSKDFIRTARAKGLPEKIVVLRHAIKGGLLPVVSFMGPAFAGLISGSFVVETIFFIPGLGRFFIMAAFNRDYTMILGTVLFYATLIIMLNLIVDVLLVLLNPRLRFD